jgi:hypothetical protein
MRKKVTPKEKAMRIVKIKQRAFSQSFTLEQFLAANTANIKQRGNEFRLIVNKILPHMVEISIRPLDRDGEIYEAYVSGYDAMPKKAINKIIMFMRNIDKPFHEKPNV